MLFILVKLFEINVRLFYWDLWRFSRPKLIIFERSRWLLFMITVRLLNQAQDQRFFRSGFLIFGCSLFNFHSNFYFFDQHQKSRLRSISSPSLLLISIRRFLFSWSFLFFSVATFLKLNPNPLQKSSGKHSLFILYNQLCNLFI